MGFFPIMIDRRDPVLNPFPRPHPAFLKWFRAPRRPITGDVYMENAIENLGQTAADKVNSARPAIADTLDSAANNLRRQSEAASATFEDGARKTAEALGMAAGYIRTHDAQEMISDAEEAARQNPKPALIIAASVGFLLGALLRR